MAATEKRAIIVTIGNELLSGSVENTNATWLARELHALGILVHLILTLPDEIEVIVRMLRPLWTDYDYIVVSGGVGPTPDDVTRPALAQLLEVPLEPHPEALAVLQNRFQGEQAAAGLAMANLPRGAIVTLDKIFLFPGFILKNFYVFPGVPRTLQRIFTAVRDYLRTEPYYTVSFTTTKWETEFAHLLTEAMQRFPQVQLGSYPIRENEKPLVRIVLTAKDQEQVNAAKRWLEERIQEEG